MDRGRGASLNLLSGVWVGGDRGILNQISGVWVGGRRGSYSDSDIRCLGGWERRAILIQISCVWVVGGGEIF